MKYSNFIMGNFKSKFRGTMVCTMLSTAVLLSGCSVIAAPVSTIKPPKTVAGSLNKDMNFENTINGLLPKGAKLMAPKNPQGASAVQKLDLDKDGSEEILVSYKIDGNEGEAGVLILRANGSNVELLGKYQSGYDVDWAGFADIDGDGKSEAIIGLRMGSTASGLNIVKLENGKLKNMVNLMYSKLEMEDMPGKNGTDGKTELAVWTKDTGAAYMTEVYRWHVDELLPEGGLIPAEDSYNYYYKRVVDYYRGKVKEMPGAAFYWYYLADAEIKAGLNDDANNSIEKGMSLHLDYPGDSAFNLLKARLLINTKEYKKAADIAFSLINDKGIKSDMSVIENLAKYYELLGESYIGLQDYEKARIYLNKSLDFIKVYVGQDKSLNINIEAYKVNSLLKNIHR